MNCGSGDDVVTQSESRPPPNLKKKKPQLFELRLFLI